MSNPDIDMLGGFGYHPTPGKKPANGQPGKAGDPSDGVTRVTHRGVRWRRAVTGTMTWYNEGLDEWVTWAPGSDAPPLPPGWEPSKAGAKVKLPAGVKAPSAGAPVARHPMRSPFRIIPLAIALVIVAFAVWQAIRPAAPASASDIAAARALQGHCLVASANSTGGANLLPTTVSCSNPAAAAKVIVVVSRAAGMAPSCPSGTDVAQVLDPGVRNEPFECVEPITH
jgi:hypothetical protein